MKIKLVVRFDPAEGPAPRITGVRLNAKTICPAPIVAATPPPIAKGLVSPCPQIFNYDSIDKNLGKWYGTLVLNFKYTMHEPKISLILDRPSLQIGVSYFSFGSFCGHHSGHLNLCQDR